MCSRPKPGEDEEELLRQQEEFLKSHGKSSVTVVNKRKAENEKSSAFAKSRDAKKKGKRINQPIDPVILGDIKEKTVEGYKHWTFKPPSVTEGFPAAFASHGKVAEEGTSIFAHSLRQKGELNMKNNSGTSTSVDTVIGSKSFIVSGSEAGNIHKENVERLNRLTSHEILAEQQKLKSQLDPKLLEFVLSRRKKAQVLDVSSTSTEMECETPTSSENIAVNSSSRSEREEIVCKEEGISEKLSATGIMKEDANKWLHMDVVEEEKLLWIGDIPPAKPVAPESPYSARFDFQGMLMPYMSENVDVREGLYNHGEEPERPGYTVEELYQLTRSSVLQQRIVALNVIANILEKTKMGYYDECLSEGLLERLLDHELFLLLRFALDDNTEAQVAATVKALRNLLCSHIDEVCLDRLLGFSRGMWQPCMFVIHEDIHPNKDQELKDTEEELKDYQMLKLDIVKGALRTDLIIRIRYILEILQPSPKAVLAVLEILIRFTRHSYDTALAVTCCPRLLQTIITQFVPQNWRSIACGMKPSEMQSVYGVPLVEALKLLRVVACRSRSFASDLVHKHFIMNSIISYISVDPRETSLPLQEVLRLSLESLYIWQVLLAYNLATQHFVDLFPVFMRLLQFHYNATSAEETQSSFGHEHGTALISLIEQAVHTAHFQDTSNERTAPKTLGYHHVKDFMRLLEMCVCKWLSQFGREQNVTSSSSKLVGAALNCLAAFYSCHIGQPDVDAVTWLESIEEFMRTQILPFLQSQGFEQASSQIRFSSCLLYNDEIGTKRDPSPLPSLGAMMWRGQCVTPVLQPKSPVPLLHGLSTFLLAVYSVHKGLSSQFAHLFLSGTPLLGYISEVAAGASAVLGTHWFTRFEVAMLVSFLRLAHLKGIDISGVFHNLAFRIITLIQKDEKFLLKEVMGRIIFNIDFLKQSSLLAQSVAELSLKDSLLFPGATSKLKLVMEAVEEIPALWNTYEEILGLQGKSPKNSAEIISFTATERGVELILPMDWTYLPIIHLHSQDRSAYGSSKESISLVVRALKWTLLVEWLRPDVTTAVSAADRFCRLAAVFLSASDLFLDPEVHTLLAAGLATLMQDYKKIKFPSSFYDLYTQLLEQFAAVSYGDALFGHFILVPLQQRHSAELRKQVWSEHAAILRILSTPVDHLMFPLVEMLEPCETDSSLLFAYLQNLISGAVRENWSPILYKVAVHHVATFIQIHQDTGLAQQIRSHITQLQDQELKALLLNYKGPPTVP